MARRGHRSLPRSIQKSLAPPSELPVASTFAPLSQSSEILQKRVEAVRPPDPSATPPEQEEAGNTTALAKREPAEMLQTMGASVLMGGQDGGGMSEFWIHLSDQILGGLEIRLNWQQGFLTATMIARTAEVQQQLQARMPQLMTHLQSKGLKIGELAVELRPRKKEAEGLLPESGS